MRRPVEPSVNRMRHALFHTVALLLISAIACPSIASARNANDITPLLIGSDIPAVSLTDKNGEIVELSTLLKGKHTIIIFYRGGWCPYCNKHLKELADAEQALLDLGYQIIAISPDSPERIKPASQKLKPHYELYSDSSLEVADAFGISFTLTDRSAKRLASFGMDLAAHSGGLNENKLPVPSVFISTPKMRISFQYADSNYKNRIPGDLLIAAAKTSLGFDRKN